MCIEGANDWMEAVASDRSFCVLVYVGNEDPAECVLCESDAERLRDQLNEFLGES